MSASQLCGPLSYPSLVRKYLRIHQSNKYIASTNTSLYQQCRSNTISTYINMIEVEIQKK